MLPDCGLTLVIRKAAICLFVANVFKFCILFLEGRLQVFWQLLLGLVYFLLKGGSFVSPMVSQQQIQKLVKLCDDMSCTWWLGTLVTVKCAWSWLLDSPQQIPVPETTARTT